MNALQKPDYGIDAPKVLRNLLLFGVLGILLGIFGPRLVQLGPVRMLPRPMFFGTGSLLLLEGFLYLFYVKVGKLYHRDRILSLHSWRGDENVLDVGCGRGLLLAGAAKRMAQLSGNGTVTGVDIWSQEDMSGNSEQATRRNLETRRGQRSLQIDRGRGAGPALRGWNVRCGRVEFVPPQHLRPGRPQARSTADRARTKARRPSVDLRLQVDQRVCGRVATCWPLHEARVGQSALYISAAAHRGSAKGWMLENLRGTEIGLRRPLVQNQGVQVGPPPIVEIRPCAHGAHPTPLRRVCRFFHPLIFEKPADG